MTVPFLENILFFEGALFFPFFSRRLLFPFLNSFFSALYRPSPGAEVVYDDAGAAVGVKCGGETAKCKFVVGDPSYFLGKVTRFSSPSHSDCHQSVIPVSFVCLRPFSNPPPPSLFFSTPPLPHLALWNAACVLGLALSPGRWRASSAPSACCRTPSRGQTTLTRCRSSCTRSRRASVREGKEEMGRGRAAPAPCSIILCDTHVIFIPRPPPKIYPPSQVGGRSNDIYVFCCSFAHRYG